MYSNLFKIIMSKKKYAAFICVFIFLTFTLDCFPQSEVLKRIDIHSPNAATLLKFQENTVDLNTGIPQISIPIYEIKTKDISIPITLSYHSGGFRVNEAASWVGLGWGLSTAFSITRSVRGGSDLEQNTLSNINYVNSLPVDPLRKGTMYTIATGTNSMDVQQDLYSVNMPGFSTKFMQFSNGQFRTLPLSDVKIQYLYNFDSYWQIIDQKGNKYIFGNSGPGITTSTDKTTSSTSINQLTGSVINPPSSSVSINYNNSWYLTKIITASGEEINFEYEQEKFINKVSAFSTLFQGNHPYYQGLESVLSEGVTIVQYVEPVLKNINFPNGKIVFERGNERKDLVRDYVMFETVGSKYLQAVKIFNYSNNEIKRALFSYSYFSPTGTIAEASLGNTLINEGYLNYRLKLENIIIQGANTTFQEKYQFEYNEDVNLPNRLSKSTDLWGYYNGKNNSTFIPTMVNYGGVAFVNFEGTSLCVLEAVVPNQTSCADNTLPMALPGTLTFTGADKSISEQHVKANVLKKIIYPTGGTVEFDFESNQILTQELTYYPGNHTAGTEGYLAPGLRVRSIKQFSESGIIATEQRYDYTDAGISSGELIDNPNYISYKQLLISPIPGTPVDGQGGCGTNKLGVEYSSLPKDIFNSNNSTGVGYKKVTKLNIGNSGNIKSVFNFHPRPIDIAGFYQTITQSPVDYHFWRRGLPLTEEHFNLENNEYKPVNKVEHVYKFKSDDGEKLELLGFDFLFHGTQITGYFVDLGSSCLYTKSIIVRTSPYKITTERFWESKTIVTDYSYTGNVQNSNTKEQWFYYENPVYNLLTKNEVKSSKGETSKTEYKYPFDYTNTPVYSEMVNRNIVSPVIEQKQTNVTLNKELSKTITNYDFWHGNTLIQPKSVQKSILGNPLETEVTINAYDSKGNVLQATDISGVITSYIWGYNSQYPVAKAINSSSNEIFFDSYEETGKWDAALSDIDKSFKRTGLSSGRIHKATAGEQVSRSTQWVNLNLTAPKKFKYSGWAYSNGPSSEIFVLMRRAGDPVGGFSSFDQISFPSQLNKWIYVEKEVIIPADVIQVNLRVDNNGGGTVWFDDLSFCPSDALMATYTYQPLVGMTSETDPNNRTTYYEYDAFNRLTIVKNQDGHIIKKICYNYAGQPEQCYIHQSADYSGTYYSQNCPYGYTADPIYVNVPAGMFTSTVSAADANTQAQQYAQNYANTNGTCTQETGIDLYYSKGNYIYTDFYVTITDVNTSNQYFFIMYAYSSYGFLGSVPPGNYNIEIFPAYGWSYYSFSAGCFNYTYGNQANFYNVEINSGCNEISVY
jgi:YD repeat-containing protein